MILMSILTVTDAPRGVKSAKSRIKSVMPVDVFRIGNMCHCALEHNVAINKGRMSRHDKVIIKLADFSVGTS